MQALRIYRNTTTPASFLELLREDPRVPGTCSLPVTIPTYKSKLARIHISRSDDTTTSSIAHAACALFGCNYAARQ